MDRSPAQHRVRYRRRGGRAAKLPPMNASERGKYYRQKYKEHEVNLERAVARLRRQVRELELLLRVRDELQRRQSDATGDAIVAQLIAYLGRVRWNGVTYDSSLQTSVESEHDPTPTSASSPRRETHPREPRVAFELHSVRVAGCTDAPVVLLHGRIHVQYTRATIDHIFPHVVHYDALLNELLDKQAEYPCTYHFYFGPSGVFEHKIVEADFVAGLHEAVGSVEDVQWLLDGSHRYKPRRDSLDDVMRGPGSAM